MKQIIIAIFCLATAANHLTAQTAEEIVSKHLAARGGIEKLNEVKAITMQNTITLLNLELENKTTVLVNRGVRSESIIMGNTMVQAFNGATAWEILPTMLGGTNQPLEMPAEKAKTVVNQIDPFQLLNAGTKGIKIVFTGMEKVKGKDAYHLTVTTRDGIETGWWIDVDTNLVCKTETMQNGQVVEIYSSNYIVVKGVSFAMHTEIIDSVAGVINVDTKSLDVNPSVDEAIFNLPVKQ